MKKFMVCILLMLISISFTGCGSGTEPKSASPTTKPASFDNLKQMPPFKLKNIINNNEVTNAIFQDNKLTMINIWGTFCSPCIEEMPTLQALNDEMKEQGVSIVGVIADGMTNEMQAFQILNKKGATFINIIPDKNFNNDFVMRTTVIPVSIFVNRNGEIVGKTIVGSKSKEEYKQLIQKALKDVM